MSEDDEIHTLRETVQSLNDELNVTVGWLHEKLVKLRAENADLKARIHHLNEELLKRNEDHSQYTAWERVPRD